MAVIAGYGGSYTKDIMRARVFYSKERAEAKCCPENEVVVPLLDVLQKVES